MGHRSPETEARVGDIRDAIAQTKQTALNSLKQEHQDREAIVHRLLTQPELLGDLGIITENVTPEDFAKRLVDFSDALRREMGTREARELVEEVRAVGEPLGGGLKRIAERHGVGGGLAVVAPVAG
jgi:hypothetical protein